MQKLKFCYRHINEVDSTNLFLQRLATENCNIAFQVVSAGFQTLGRGMDQNKWHSQPDQNLLFSMCLNVDFIEAARQFRLSQAVSVSILQVLKSLLPEPDLKIKWPNDIYFGNKKLAGILIYNLLSGKMLDNTIIGLGLNVNETDFPDFLPNPISMKLITGQTYDTADLMYQLVETIYSNVEELRTQYGVGKIEKSYIDNVYRFEEWALYEIEGQVMEMKMLGFNQFGFLQLINKNGQNYSCDIKQIKFAL